MRDLTELAPTPAWDDIPRERQIIAEVALAHGLKVLDLIHGSRKRHVVLARWRAWERLRAELNMSLNQIGRLFDRDHKTILNGLNRIAELTEE